MSTEASIRSVCQEVEELLLRKNKAYGDAALSPVNIFSALGAEDSIKVRIDDKLKRIQNVGLNDATEDTLLDLVGYMILLIIKRNESHHIQEHLRQASPAPHQPLASPVKNTDGQQLQPYNTD
jgi:hypothetical protein